LPVFPIGMVSTND